MRTETQAAGEKCAPKSIDWHELPAHYDEAEPLAAEFVIGVRVSALTRPFLVSPNPHSGRHHPKDER